MALIDRYLKKKDSKIELERSRPLLIDKYSPRKEVPFEIEPEKKPLFDRIKGVGVGAGKFVTRLGIETANLLTSTLDFTADFLAGQAEKQTRRPSFPVGPFAIPIGKETEARKKVADRWKNFYEQTGGEVTEKTKSFTEELREIDFIQPSEEWAKASTKEKFTKRLPETILNIGPGVVSSLALFAISPPLGFAASAGSVADEVKTIAIEEGVNKDRAELLGLGTGLLVGWLDKIVPDEVFSPAQKKAFVGGFAKRIVKTGLKETVTEIAQENIQLLAEATVREDITKDEVVFRNLMSGLGGLLGGVGAQTTVSFVNGVRSGDIAGLEEDFDKPVVTEPAEEIAKAPEIEPEIAVVGDKKVLAKVARETRQPIKEPVIQKREVSTKEAKLPSNLTFAKPRFGFGAKGLFSIDFESDVDKALFIVAQEKRSASDEKYMDFLRESLTGLEDGEIRSFGRQVKASIKDRIANDIGVADNVVTFPVNAVRVSIKKEVEVKKVEPKKPVNLKMKTKEAVISQVKEVKLVTEKSVENVKNIKDVKTALSTIRKNFVDLTSQIEGQAIVAQEQREGLNVKDINQLKRTVARSKKFQEGDIETIRASNTGPLLNRVIENIQEKNPDMSEAEAFDFALGLPTQATAQQRTTAETRELAKKEKTLSKFLKTLQAKQKDLDIQQDDALFKQWQSVLDAQEKLIQVIKVPSRQLPVGEGKVRASRLQARLKGVLKNASPEDIEDLGLSTYRQSIQDVQIAKANEYVKNNTEDAVKVVFGEIDPPKGMLQNSVYIALTELGRIDTDVATKVATLGATRFGQEIAILKKILADNPVVMMQDIVDVRIEAYEKRTGRTAKQRIKTEVEKIGRETKAPDIKSWNSFLDSIKC